MDTPTVDITHRAEFSASHRLHNPDLSDGENERIYGICNNANGHGHNYALEVTVRGSVPARTGMVMNLVDLERAVAEEILSRVDHRHLNHDVPFLAGVNPTAENVVMAFWRVMKPALAPFEACRLHRIRLYESRNSYVEYSGTPS